MPVFLNRNIRKDHIISLLQIERVKKNLKKAISYTPLPTSIRHIKPLHIRGFVFYGGRYGGR